ncbi:peptidoglycan-binding domain-containing protein [Cellulomonas triticagri]|uniref:peptidoglycan-binding domain-containing protein n=1 Tax=Cellulomonas triticagri TaxID=2483352 RepID=UPI00131558D3|nr:peptidoglycan-binding domain-containing protein [Cellulomonas triticagri]
MRPRTRHVAIGLVLGALGGSLVTVGVALVRPGALDAARPTDADRDAPVTVPVVRQVLEDVEPVAGALAWARVDEPLAVDGVVTALPVEHGAPVVPGAAVIEVNDRPVIALDLPFGLWRDLDDGDSGADVRNVHAALAGLGLYSGAIDAPFGQATRAALASVDGRLDGPLAAAEVVAVEPTGSVLDAPGVRVGSRVTAEDLSVRRLTDRVVVDDGGLVAEYARAGDGIRLFDAGGEVTWAGRLAQVEAVPEGTLLTLDLSEPPDGSDALPDELASAAVVAGATRVEVLTLPRVALVAGADGTSSVTTAVVGPEGVVPGARTVVRTGLCTRDLCEVEVADDGALSEGDLVVVP